MGIKDKIKNAEVSLWPFGIGMSIDEAINYLIAPKIASTEVTPEMQKQLDAHAIVIDIMRKYQKIEQIYQKWNEVNDFSYNQAMREIGEVIEDGKID